VSIGERLEDDWDAAVTKVRELTGHPRTSAAQAAAAVTIRTSTPGGPVSLSADLHAFAARLEHYDEDALIALDAVKGNAATDAAFAVLRDLTGFNVSPDIITLVTTGLTELRDRLKANTQPAEPQFTPAGPQVAGQAQG
jgi:hypothetical protein